MLQLARRSRLRFRGVIRRLLHLPILSGNHSFSHDDRDSLSSTSCPNYRVQYSDQSEGERALTLNKFRKATAEWNSVCSRPLQLDGDEDRCPSHLMVITDACLPALSFAEAPLQARVLINFEVPTKVRRLALFSINSSLYGNFLA